MTDRNATNSTTAAIVANMVCACAHWPGSCRVRVGMQQKQARRQIISAALGVPLVFA
jgi:hypothetical protein